MKKNEMVIDSMIDRYNCPKIHRRAAKKADRDNLPLKLRCIALDRVLVKLPSGQIDP